MTDPVCCLFCLLSLIIVLPRDLRPLFRSGPFWLGWGQGYLFTLGPPLGPQSEIGAPPWAPLWNSCCSAARSRDPLGAFQKSFKAKNGNLKISSVFPSKIEPWRTFADPGPPKKGPLGPVPLSRGPPWKSLERKTHLWEPSLAPP